MKNKNKLRLIPIIVILGCVILVFVFYKIINLSQAKIVESHISPKSDINISEVNEKQPPSTEGMAYNQKKSQLRVAIAPIFTPEMSLRLYDGLVKYLGKQVNRESIILQRQTYAEINEVIRDGICDIAFVCTFPYVRGEKDFGMKLLAIPVIEGKTTYNSFIIVPVESRAKSLLDLHGRKFASADIFSCTGWLFPASWLINKGENPRTFFSKHLLAGGHDRSIQSVLFGYVDGAAVCSIVYEQMAYEDSTIKQKTKIIQESPPYGMPPVVAHPDLDPALMHQILNTLLTMHQDAEGKKVLSVQRIERFLTPKKEMYNSVRKAIKMFESIK
jgi:phosphonate transport system substrate-binding protein